MFQGPFGDSQDICVALMTVDQDERESRADSQLLKRFAKTSSASEEFWVGLLCLRYWKAFTAFIADDGVKGSTPATLKPHLSPNWPATPWPEDFQATPNFLATCSFSLSRSTFANENKSLSCQSGRKAVKDDIAWDPEDFRERKDCKDWLVLGTARR